LNEITSLLWNFKRFKFICILIYTVKHEIYVIGKKLFASPPAGGFAQNDRSLFSGGEGGQKLIIKVEKEAIL
jgi:hypothetical protein